MSDMPTHTPFPGDVDVPQPEYEPGGPDLPDSPEIPPEMPDPTPFNDDGSTVA
jgi:hypothetical protein